jgi:hypothetical protein
MEGFVRLESDCLVRPRNVGEIVERYILEYRDKHEREMNFYREQPSLRKAVSLAAHCIGMCGKSIRTSGALPKKP